MAAGRGPLARRQQSDPGEKPFKYTFHQLSTPDLPPPLSGLSSGVPGAHTAPSSAKSKKNGDSSQRSPKNPGAHTFKRRQKTERAKNVSIRISVSTKAPKPGSLPCHPALWSGCGCPGWVGVRKVQPCRAGGTQGSGDSDKPSRLRQGWGAKPRVSRHGEAQI